MLRHLKRNYPDFLWSALRISIFHGLPQDVTCSALSLAERIAVLNAVRNAFFK